jgi:hypothetical protein
MKRDHQHDNEEEKEIKESRILKQFPASWTCSSKPGQLDTHMNS